jgi:hypothetical protein
MCLCACAGTPVGPFFEDERYLTIGIDPRAESAKVVEGHKAQGEVLSRRIDGQNFTALAFNDRLGRPAAVRVVTLRGITVELDRDAGSALTPETTYALLAAPLASSQDADGDGFEEVFIERRKRDLRCVLVYRVRDVGTVDAVEVNAQLFGQTRCPTNVEDIDADGRAELIAEVAFAKGHDAPRIRVPLFAHDHHFSVDGDPAALARFCATERATRASDLQQARATLDVDAAYRLAVELAALSQLAGEPAARQLQVFDDALSGLVLSAAQSSVVGSTRLHIYTGWNADHPRDKAAELVSTPAP